MSNATGPKTEKSTVKGQETPSGDPVRKELSDAQIQEVAGGLSPQPLPPRHQQA